MAIRKSTRKKRGGGGGRKPPAAARWKVPTDEKLRLPIFWTVQEVAKALHKHPTTVARHFRGRNGVGEPPRGTSQHTMLISQQALFDYLVESGFDPAVLGVNAA
jgi:hypothetical protein